MVDVALKSQNRKYQASKRLGQIKTSNTAVNGDAKRFSRRDLVEACRKEPHNHQDPGHSSMRKKITPRSKLTSSFQSADKTDVGSQLRILDDGVKLCAKRLNECKAQADQLEEELKKKIDGHKGLTCESDALSNMISGNNHEARRIEQITSEIEKMNRCCDEKLHYRLQLNHTMKQRLQKNSISLDAHLGAMHDTLDSAEKEKEKCERMLGCIESSCRQCIRNLEDTENEIQIERSNRQLAMSTRKSEVDNAERMEAWRKDREISRLELEESYGGAHNREKERRIRVLGELRSSLETLRANVESKSAELGVSEESFTHIKQATGINSLIEMVEKFMHHQEHRDCLLAEKKEEEDRSSNARQSLQNVTNEFERIKAEGFGDTELSREIVDSIQERINQEKTKGKVAKSLSIRLEELLVGLRQGGMGLYLRLLAFHPTLLDGEIETPNISESATTSPTQAAFDTLEMIKITQQILGKMVDQIGGIESIIDNEGDGKGGEDSKDDEPKANGSSSIETFQNPNLGANNCRIKPKEYTPRLSDDEDGDDRSRTGPIIDGNDDTIVVEHDVPSRYFLKSKSARKTSEAKRDEEMDEKQRKLREKAAASDDANPGGIAELKKRQKETSKRMAQHSLPIGLPKSLSVRDDPMTKAQAFLTELPHLD
eukprot:CAMPEP_0194396914 /NCGR_PEP_ID=MMETSP0174-20130528/125252_1 /TAXON_ID=216777 /ORGANISM="Proboscia alata, Strain PI-D3" /LENGTH=657 /DNA_ID=CAMNT_0039193031 /DNA_START=9 /DNA_END=1982 /DNA_ORIENTATION=+